MIENQYSRLAKQNFLRRVLAESRGSREVLEDVIKFHQSTTNIPKSDIYNINNTYLKESSTNIMEEIDSAPIFYEHNQKINHEKTSNLEGSYLYDKEYIISSETIEKIITISFINNHSQSNEFMSSNNALLPILLIFKNNVVEGLPAGTYIFDEQRLSLLQIRKWEPTDMKDVIQAFIPRGKLPSYTAIAYAMDIQKATYIYGKKGYRQALIEIGAVKQRFKHVIENLAIDKQLGQHSSTDFPDNMVSNICGTNIRLAPIVLVQWFGKIMKGETNVS